MLLEPLFLVNTFVDFLGWGLFGGSLGVRSLEAAPIQLNLLHYVLEQAKGVDFDLKEEMKK